MHSFLKEHPIFYTLSRIQTGLVCYSGLMRPLWSGSISFGLINIPVQLFSAARERVLSFSMLHKDDLSPISYSRVCRADGKEVPYEEIVKGYEYREGDFAVLNPEDFKRADPKETQAIEIQEFVDEADIASKYYKKPYYLEPDAGAAKAYVLLREALEHEHKVAVAKMVFHDREHLVVLKPDQNILVLNTLRFDDEIRETGELKIPAGAEVSRAEVEMAVKLIASMRGKFDPKTYHDTYTEKLEKTISAKAKGQKLKPIAKVTVKPTAPEDLVAQLRESLKAHA